MFYFAYIDATNLCTGVYALPSDLSGMPGYVSITEEQYTSQSVVGKYWNADTQTWTDPVEFSCSSDEVRYKQTEQTLSSKLDAMDAAIAAAGSGSGTAGADGEDGATFTPAVAADGTLSWTNDKGLTNPTPVNIKGPAGETGAPGAAGVNGITPTIGENGHWYIGTTDTGVSAQGPAGATGATGATGPAGADGTSKIHFGNYTGNGSTVQMIDLGFTAQCVILYPENGAQYKDGYHYGGMSYVNGVCSANSQAVFMASGSTLFAYNSGTSRANENGKMYYYIAFEA